MAFVRCSGGNRRKVFTTNGSMSFLTQTVVDDVLTASGSTNVGSSYGFPQNVPITIGSFTCSAPFIFNGSIDESGYVALELYENGIKVAETPHNATSGLKTISHNCNGGAYDVKINNWRGLASGGGIINYSGV